MNLPGIQFRLLLLGIVPTLLLVSSLAFYFIQYHYYDLENALQEKGQITINQLAISSIYGVFSGNQEVLDEITSALLNEPDIVCVQVFDSSGNSLSIAELKPRPDEKELLFFHQPVTIHSLRTKYNSEINAFSEQTSKLPIKKIGRVKIILSLTNTHKKQSTYLLNSLLLIFIGITCSTLLAIRLKKSIADPIIDLTKTANALAKGNMHARAKSSRTAELELLCQSFNSMATGVQDTQSHLRQLVDKALQELNKTLLNLEDKNKSLEKTTQLAVSQNKTKSQFIAHISHEIRTPMNGILGFIELLTNSQLSLQQLDQAQLIKSSATNLLTIVNEILDYSSLETGNFKINKISFDFREVIENCVSIISSTSGDVRIIIDIDNSIPKSITSDPNRIQQVVTNLLGNANKFTHSGHIILRCRLRNFKSLFISISDTGTGIHQNKINTLFQPFQQASDYANDNKLGTGLGLTISKNIVERLQGSIGVCSQYNTGSIFWFNIPVDLPEIKPLILKQQSFIVIDSFTLRRNAFAKQLKFLGYTVTASSSLAELKQRSCSPSDLLFYAKKNNNELENSVLQQIHSFTNGPIIFIPDSNQKKIDPLFLSLPCRSSFLESIINSHLNHNQETPSALPVNSTQRHDSVSIFIADDNEINRLLLQSQLEGYCNDITLANEGRSALGYLQKHKYDLILLDLQMPYFSGLELIKVIKQEDSINQHSPVIAITAHAQSHQRKILIDAGFDECLIKPILMEQLEELLGLWLPVPAPATKQDNGSLENVDYVSTLLKRTSGNTTLAATIFNKLFTELPQQCKQIELALTSSNLSLAQETTHKLHGSVSFCGFSEIQALAHQLESSFPENNLQLIQSNFNLLKDKIADFLKLKDKILNCL